MSSEPPDFRPKSPFGPGASDAPPRERAGAYAQLDKEVAAIGELPIENADVDLRSNAARQLASHAVDVRPEIGIKNWWKRRPVQLAIVFGVAALPSLYWLITSTAFRATAFGGFIGLWLALSSIWLVVVRFGLDRDRPRDMTLPALAAGCGALALAFGGVMAHYLRGEATAIAASNEVHEPGMREFLIAEAHGNGRFCALIALIGLPGALLGGLTLALVLGARRVATDAPEREAPVWVALSVSAFTIVIGFVTSVWAAVLPVEDAKNPREARVKEVADDFGAGNLKAACPELEAVLVPDYVTREVLDRELPGRVELAHRCTTLLIDDLPLGRACDAGLEKLLASETVKLAKAQERVRQACKTR